MTQTSLWWIRRDIRLQDNPALHAAVQQANYLVPVFIIEPELMARSAPRRRAFLLNALTDLSRQLKAAGSQLVILTGPAHEALSALAQKLINPVIFAHEDFSPYARERDALISKILPLEQSPGVVIHHPDAVLKGDGTPYVVFTPYKNRWYRHPLPSPADILPPPDRLPPFPEGLISEPLPYAEPSTAFPASTKEAENRLRSFASGGLLHYQSQRDRIDLNGTSQLSPYLRFGLISARETFVQAQIATLQAREDRERAEIRTWMDELVWREFYTAILYHYPRVIDGPFREVYQNLRWRNAPEDLRAWQQGQTGYPIVDACMRQLRETGWMHNRGRMIVASFLTKDLLINWQAGEAYFMNTLIDGDPAANNGGWQWSAGTGTDAAPYFRIFNPTIQGQKFDPHGDFIARWVPGLSKLPPKYRHEPWNLNKENAQKYAFKIGEDYPHRLIDHAFARERTLAAYRAARENSKPSQDAT